ncbi:MAG: hypothetical protein RIE58_08230 [Vicingaceae bacterium]
MEGRLKRKIFASFFLTLISIYGCQENSFEATNKLKSKVQDTIISHLSEKLLIIGRVDKVLFYDFNIITVQDSLEDVISTIRYDMFVYLENKSPVPDSLTFALDSLEKCKLSNPNAVTGYLNGCKINIIDSLGRNKQFNFLITLNKYFKIVEIDDIGRVLEIAPPDS